MTLDEWNSFRRKCYGAKRDGRFVDGEYELASFQWYEVTSPCCAKPLLDEPGYDGEMKTSYPALLVATCSECRREYWRVA